jgi:hypothetical protein
MIRRDEPSKDSISLPSTITSRYNLKQELRETNLSKVEKISDQYFSQEGELCSNEIL